MTRSATRSATKPHVGEEAQAPKGERTRRAILEAAVDLASAEGLEGVTIGRLAAELEMSKSGLFAHFGSKEELQLSCVDAARQIFFEQVIRPALRGRRGIARLRALCDEWISYAERKVFRGGCFFDAAAAEFDSRPGPVRDRIADNWRDWMSMLETAVRQAQAAGELDPSVDPRQIAYELNALATAANKNAQLLGEHDAWRRALVATHRLLDSLAVAPPSGG
ncbi:MAG TPA: TetR/AcrR family transcriptional regulator [Thermoanaerobaculia bacterium]|nr:TetR/AcrR family transcriptional regulator [Thermoanaerobaculia bacterium]